MTSIFRGSDNFDTAGGNAVKAWVNFNGTGTVAIRAAFNVSSITDNGVGSYSVNFTVPMPDTNYSVLPSSGGTAGAVVAISNDVAIPRTVNFASISVVNTGFASIDAGIVQAAVFR